MKNEMRPWTDEEFEARLRAMGERYHIHHPFQVMMHRGQLSQQQIQGWVANRYYYQISIPIKDAAILANCPEREVRRHWVQRILDHDGYNGEEGGIEAWIRLGEAVGLSRETIVSQELVLPGVRFAVDG
jgi:pyrroloquinoline-quinone synthase